MSLVIYCSISIIFSAVLLCNVPFFSQLKLYGEEVDEEQTISDSELLAEVTD